MFSCSKRKYTSSILAIMQLSGCFARKIVTVSMRVVGAIVSLVPVVGNVADDAFDVAADTVDLIHYKWLFTSNKNKIP